MALITISGYPSSGKTTRALQIKADLEKRLQDPTYSGPQLKVTLLSDDILNIDRSVYDGKRFYWLIHLAGQITLCSQKADLRNLPEELYLQQCRGKWVKTRYSLSMLQITSKGSGIRCIVRQESTSSGCALCVDGFARYHKTEIRSDDTKSRYS
jgi:hypothetical protein